MVGMSGSALFQAFESGAVGDEMFSPDGSVRPTYAALHRALSRIGLEDFRTRSEALARSYLDQGITFDYEGEERPFPIDAEPRLIAAEEWETVSAGIAQRVCTLEHLLADHYSEQLVIVAGVVRGT